MASSDDQGEEGVTVASNYYLVDDNDEPISLSELPIKWDEVEVSEGKVKEIFLEGYTDSGFQKFYRQVKAWKFDLSHAKPEISVLSIKNEWIKLLKPRNSFRETIRTVLITVQFLHLLKKDPKISVKALWDKLAKSLRPCEVKPSRGDLFCHMGLISEAVKHDQDLEKSNVLVTLLKKKLINNRTFDKDVGGLENFSDASDGKHMRNDSGVNRADLSDREKFDVCVICDNGGKLLSCRRCQRSFHATKKAGSVSACYSLGLSYNYVKRIKVFLCENCKYNKHQCYACGKLGSSDKFSGREVFPCVKASCSHYYHPCCVAKLLHPDNETKAGELQGKIAAGEHFSCPVHECFDCKMGEDKDKYDLQFAICRRCPKSYHRKCLPREVAFETNKNGIIPRAWTNLLPNRRILLYCLDHEIDAGLLTPLRNHIKFPSCDEKEERSASVGKMKVMLPQDASRKRIDTKASKGVEKFASIKLGDSTRKTIRQWPIQHSLGKRKVKETADKTSNKPFSESVIKSNAVEDKTSLGKMLHNSFSEDSDPDESLKAERIDISAAEEISSFSALDTDSKRRILSLIKDAASCIIREDIEKNHAKPTAAAYLSKSHDKHISSEKVETSVEALHAALQKRVEGGKMEDSKAVCELINEIVIWKDKLEQYLAPFLYGVRYTFFDRHFSKVDKLNAIVDRLHWYVEDGDMIVDFFSGANDFSCLMKKKLEEMGKRCSYRNDNIVQAKNELNFEKSDWMTVSAEELARRSKLIVGLNPPLGGRAGRGYSFIEKVLEFNPKLLILIVSPEIERLRCNEKNVRYDLIWQDHELLSGQSFCLPGSVGGTDKEMEEWNENAPLLYLWSRPDWTAKHKLIAEQLGHFTRKTGKLVMKGNHSAMTEPDPVAECRSHNCRSPPPVAENPLADRHEIFQENGGGAASVNARLGDILASRTCGFKKKSRTGKRKRAREPDEVSPEEKPARKLSAFRCPPPVTAGAKTLPNNSWKPLESSPGSEFSRECHQQSEESRSRLDRNQVDAIRRHSMKAASCRLRAQKLDFAVGPYEPSSSHGSCGWLDE